MYAFLVLPAPGSSNEIGVSSAWSLNASQMRALWPSLAIRS